MNMKQIMRELEKIKRKRDRLAGKDGTIEMWIHNEHAGALRRAVRRYETKIIV